MTFNILGICILIGLFALVIGKDRLEEPDTTEVIIHAQQGIICEVDEYDEIWCSVDENWIYMPPL